MTPDDIRKMAEQAIREKIDPVVLAILERYAFLSIPHSKIIETLIIDRGAHHAALELVHGGSIPKVFQPFMVNEDGSYPDGKTLFDFLYERYLAHYKQRQN
jgi:hypothetical protein